MLAAVVKLFLIPLLFGGAARADEIDELLLSQVFGEANKHVVVDGVMDTRYQEDGRPDDYEKIIHETFVDLMSVGTARNFERQPGYVRTLEGVENGRIIRTSNDIELSRRYNELGILFYIQKPWPIVQQPDESLWESVSKAVDEWYNDGALRIVQLAYNANDNAGRLGGDYYAGGNNEPDVGLSRLGRLTAYALLRKYVLLDVSHMGKASTLEIIELAKLNGRSVAANHANSQALRNWNRNKDDESICKIADTDGVIGLTPIRTMLKPNGVTATFEDLIPHMNHVRDLDCTPYIGRQPDMIDHMGVSTDSYVDGWEATSTFYVDEVVSTPDRWLSYARAMYLDHGYSLADMRKIFGGNFMRVYNRELPGLRQFQLSSPVNNERISGTSVTMEWGHAYAQGVPPPEYRVHLYQRQPDGSYDRIRSSSYGPNRRHTFDDLPENERFRWYVHARNTEGTWVNAGYWYFDT